MIICCHAKGCNIFEVKDKTFEQIHKSQWFAIRTMQDLRAEKILGLLCDEVFFPKKIVSVNGKKTRELAIIPHVLFIKTSRENALALEMSGRKYPETSIPFWIYRYPDDDEIQVISQSAINLLRLLTADDPTQCEIFNKSDFGKSEQRVRIIGGIYKGYEGYVKRVKKNKHVIVKIEGVSLVMLPYIHPDLLEKIG